MRCAYHVVTISMFLAKKLDDLKMPDESIRDWFSNKSIFYAELSVFFMKKIWILEI